MDIENVVINTDLYQLTMMQGYFLKGKNKPATFDMFYRSNPFKGSYCIFAGLEDVVSGITRMRFTERQIRYLGRTKLFSDEFLAYLRDFRFTGEVYSVNEGEVVFPNEPLIRVTAPMIQAQLVETYILNCVNYPTLVATKANRMVNVIQGNSLLEFGLRRAPGMEAGLSASRSAFIGGFQATSNVLAGYEYDIPIKGTQAHSWIMSFDTELEAFQAYADTYPDACLLLVDTYNTLKQGVPNAIEVLAKLKADGHVPIGIRIDSGDLEYLSKEARAMLDEAGLFEAKICVSNDLDEYIIDQLLNRDAPIDIFGVGTSLVTTKGKSSLGGVYKLVENEGKPVIKISDNIEKITNPGRKQIVRFFDKEKQALADVLMLEDEVVALKEQEVKNVVVYHPAYEHQFTDVKYDSYRELLQLQIQNGMSMCERGTLQMIQNYSKKRLDSFHDTYKRLWNPHSYKVGLSTGLSSLKNKLLNERGTRDE